MRRSSPLRKMHYRINETAYTEMPEKAKAAREEVIEMTTARYCGEARQPFDASVALTMRTLPSEKYSRVAAIERLSCALARPESRVIARQTLKANVAHYGPRGENSSIAFAKSEANLTEGWDVSVAATPRDHQRHLDDVNKAALANSKRKNVKVENRKGLRDREEEFAATIRTQKEAGTWPPRPKSAHEELPRTCRRARTTAADLRAVAELDAWDAKHGFDQASEVFQPPPVAASPE